MPTCLAKTAFRRAGRVLSQLPHSTPCFGFMKAHKCLVFKEEFWKAYIVTNTISFSLDFLMK